MSFQRQQGVLPFDLADAQQMDQMHVKLQQNCPRFAHPCMESAMLGKPQACGCMTRIAADISYHFHTSVFTFRPDDAGIYTSETEILTLGLPGYFPRRPSSAVPRVTSGMNSPDQSIDSS